MSKIDPSLPVSDVLRLDAANTRLQTLYSKQGRLRQFATATERDSFLQGEIKSIKEFQKRQSQALEDLRGLAQDTIEQISALEAQEADLQNALNTRHEQLRELEGTISANKDLKAAREERRKYANVSRRDSHLTRLGSSGGKKQSSEPLWDTLGMNYARLNVILPR